MDQKKRHVVSYEKMSEELAQAFSEKYPRGFNDYFPDLVKYPKPDGTSFYAVTVEIPDAIYLVKIQVKTDDMDDIEKWLEGEEDAGNEQMTGRDDVGSDGETPLPDDNIAQYGGDDDSSEVEAYFFHKRPTDKLLRLQPFFISLSSVWRKRRMPSRCTPSRPGPGC